jgi:hypothetical protein
MAAEMTQLHDPSRFPLSVLSRSSLAAAVVLPKTLHAYPQTANATHLSAHSLPFPLLVATLVLIIAKSFSLAVKALVNISWSMNARYESAVMTCNLKLNRRLCLRGNPSEHRVLPFPNMDRSGKGAV